MQKNSLWISRVGVLRCNVAVSAAPIFFDFNFPSPGWNANHSVVSCSLFDVRKKVSEKYKRTTNSNYFFPNGKCAAPVLITSPFALNFSSDNFRYSKRRKAATTKKAISSGGATTITNWKHFWALENSRKDMNVVSVVMLSFVFACKQVA